MVLHRPIETTRLTRQVNINRQTQARLSGALPNPEALLRLARQSPAILTFILASLLESYRWKKSPLLNYDSCYAAPRVPNRRPVDRPGWSKPPRCGPGGTA